MSDPNDPTPGAMDSGVPAPENTRPAPPPLPGTFLPSTAPPPPGTAAASTRGTAVHLGQLPPPPPAPNPKGGTQGPGGHHHKKKKMPWSFWVALLLLIMLLGSGLLNIAQVMMSGIGDTGGMGMARNKRPYREQVMEGSGTNKIVLIPVDGVIMDVATGGGLFGSPESLVDRVLKELDQAMYDPNVKAVVLVVNSPGGGVTASDVIYNRILKLKQAGKKVVAHMGDICASGGYYISAPADKIVASPTTITGSIGVIMHFFDAHKLMEDKLQLKEVSIQSGKHKDIGSYAREMTIEDLQILQGMIDEMYLRFVDIVAEGRLKHKNMDGSLDEVKAKVKLLADGRIYTGVQAEKNGLVDSVGYLDDAIDSAKELAGLHDASVIQYKTVVTLADVLGGGANSKTNVNVNNGIQVDANGFFNQRGPRMEYMWNPSH